MVPTQMLMVFFRFGCFVVQGVSNILQKTNKQSTIQAIQDPFKYAFSTPACIIGLYIVQ